MYIDYHLGEVLVQRNLDVIDAGIALVVPLEGKQHVNTAAGIARDGRAAGRRCKDGSYLGMSVRKAPDSAGLALLHVVRFASINSKELVIATWS